MQAVNNDIIAHAWTVEKTPWTYESDRKDAEAGNDKSPIYISLAACISTVAMNISIVQLSREPMKKSYDKIYQYTVRLLTQDLRGNDTTNGWEYRCAIRGP